MELEIEKTLVLSTAHITKKDDNLLQKCSNSTQDELPPLVVDIIQCGCKVLVNANDFGVYLEDIIRLFSEGFVKCLMLAYVYDCTWLNLDADGPILDFLPQYNW